MRDTKAKANRPAPPEEIEGESLLEWDRLCADLEAAGRLDKTDRGIITLYCQTWAVYQLAMQHVVKFGPIVKHQNGVAGESPHYKASRETTNQLRRLLNDMGLTPAARGKGAAVADPGELEI